MHSKQKTKHQHEDIQIETNQTKLSIERFRHGNIMILIFTLAYEILHATKNLTFFTPLYT